MVFCRFFYLWYWKWEGSTEYLLNTRYLILSPDNPSFDNTTWIQFLGILMSTSKVLRASKQGCRKSAGHPMCPENGLYFPSFLQNLFAICCHFPLFSVIFRGNSLHFLRKVSGKQKVPGIPYARIHLFCSHTSEVGQGYHFKGNKKPPRHEETAVCQ